VQALLRHLGLPAILVLGAFLASYFGRPAGGSRFPSVPMMRQSDAGLLLAHPGSRIESPTTTDCYAKIDSTPDITYTSVQDAVDAATIGDVVRVAGTCSGVETRSGVTQTLYISKTLSIRGGYTTTNWITPNTGTYPTTLDALGQGRVLYITGSITPTIEGLRITGGDVHFREAGIPAHSGGGVFIMTATATIRDSEVFGNSAYHGGGLGLHSSDATVSGNVVRGNTATEGGGLYVGLSSTTLSGNIIASNTASGVGGGMVLYSSPSVLSGNTIISNTAVYGGGGAYLNASAATLSGNKVRGNTASGGGGLYLTCYTIADLRGNTLSGNQSHDGGGLYVWESEPTLTNSMVVDNQADRGSGLFISGSSAKLLHTTVARSGDVDGSGIYVTGHHGAYYSSVSLTNTVLASYVVAITVTEGSTATLEGTLWHGTGRETGGSGGILTGTVNVWGDPAFLDPGSGDYHIGSGSAAMDAGVDAGITTDIDGHRRPMGEAVDIGADERYAVIAYIPVILTD
jgi:parallel beta-helix repeat protein